jgi:hypothetical protein
MSPRMPGLDVESAKYKTRKNRLGAWIADMNRAHAIETPDRGNMKWVSFDHCSEMSGVDSFLRGSHIEIT